MRPGYADSTRVSSVAVVGVSRRPGAGLAPGLFLLRRRHQARRGAWREAVVPSPAGLSGEALGDDRQEDERGDQGHEADEHEQEEAEQHDDGEEASVGHALSRHSPQATRFM